MFRFLNNLCNDIKEFRKFRKFKVQKTLINCRHDKCKYNTTGVCDRPAIILDYANDNLLSCIYTEKK